MNDGVRPAGHGQPFLTRVNLTGFTNARYQRRRKALEPVLVDRQPRETQQPKEALSNLLNLVVLCQAIVKPCRTFVNLCRTIVEPLSNIVENLSNFVEKMNTRTLSSVVLASFGCFGIVLSLFDIDNVFFTSIWLIFVAPAASLPIGNFVDRIPTEPDSQLNSMIEIMAS